MKLDCDCVREILIEVEKKPFHTSLTLDDLYEAIPRFSSDEIEYCCLKLNEANFLNLITVPIRGQLTHGIKSINDLTFYGHEFLSDIRNDSTWNKTKEIAKNIGSFSIHAISDIASSVVTDLITKQF